MSRKSLPCLHTYAVRKQVWVSKIRDIIRVESMRNSAVILPVQGRLEANVLIPYGAFSSRDEDVWGPRAQIPDLEACCVPNKKHWTPNQTAAVWLA